MKKDKQLIDKLIKILSKNNLTEITFSEKDFKIKIKKDSMEEVIEKENLNNVVEKEKNYENIKEIKSNNVGKFYYYDKTGNPMISIGQVIKVGQIIGYISTVGIKTPIKSKISGTIEDIYLKNGEVTDYGKSLIKLKEIKD